jgi:hypothetical protein
MYKQFLLSFVGKLLARAPTAGLNRTEAETLLLASDCCELRVAPLTPSEVSVQLLLADNRTRIILHSLIEKKTAGNGRRKLWYRTYRLAGNVVPQICC